MRDWLKILSVEAALINVPETFYRTYPTEAQIVLSGLKNTNSLLARLLDGGHVLAAGRIAGALRRMGRNKEADIILKKMKAADYDVRERDPFSDIAHLMPLQIGASPLAARINAAWDKHEAPSSSCFPMSPAYRSTMLLTWPLLTTAMSMMPVIRSLSKDMR